MPSVRGSCTTCTSCSQKSHVHYFTHSPHFLRCLRCSRAALICTTASCISLPLCHSRCSCLFIQRLALRLSWTENSRGRVEFQCIQLSHWVDGCLLLWRCRPHRIFMWETQTYCELFGSDGADTHTDPLSHFSFFLLEGQRKLLLQVPIEG